MKAIFFIFLVFISSIACCQQDTTGNKIHDLLLKAGKQQLNKDELKEVRSYATNIQNSGFHLEEFSHDYRGALTNIDQALDIWHLLRDTFNIANLHKYKGYLLGHLNRFSEAKTEIDSAIRLFSAVKYPSGVAVSKFDLSKVYESELKLDSSLKYAVLTLTFWKIKKDTTRIMISYNQIINLYLKMKEYKLAANAQDAASLLLTKKNLYWRQVMDFYFLSIQLYKKLNRAVLQQKYQVLFDDKWKELSAENISPVVGFSEYP
jgi:hypothetical protein